MKAVVLLQKRQILYNLVYGNVVLENVKNIMVIDGLFNLYNHLLF